MIHPNKFHVFQYMQEFSLYYETPNVLPLFWRSHQDFFFIQNERLQLQLLDLPLQVHIFKYSTIRLTRLSQLYISSFFLRTCAEMMFNPCY